jgi:hypothetical protein
VRLLVLAGSGLLITATFVPSNGGGRAGYPYAIYDRSVQRELELFAAEPLAVAVLAVLAALLLLRRARVLTAGLLLAFGAQTFLLFLAHVGIAAFGNPHYNSFRPGGLLGVVGALLLVGGGVLTLLLRPQEPSGGDLPLQAKPGRQSSSGRKPESRK